jgi:cobalt-zinc-cadmium efflux system outer membrane protein
VTPVASDTLTVEEAVTLALRQNPRLSAAARDVVAAQAGVRSARALTNPTLVFVPSLFGTGSDEEILFQQPLELNGTRSARTGVAQAQLRQTQAEAVISLRNLVLDTRSAYYELARTQELRTLAQDVLRTAQEVHRGVRRQAEEGLRPLIDPVQTEIEVSRAQQQLTLAASQVLTAQATLNTHLGRPAGQPVAALPLLPNPPGSPPPGTATPEAPGGTPPGVPPPGVGQLNQEELTTRALTSRAEIAVEAAQRDQFRQEARLARAQGRPDIAPQFRSESILREPRSPGVGIGFTLPFLDYGSRRNRVRQAEAAAQAQEARITASQNLVRQEVTQALTRLQAAEAVIRSYQAGVLDQSRRLRDASLQALQLGAPGASILTVLEAQRTYRNVLTEYTNALAQQAQGRAELERATGAVPADLLPRPETSSGRETRR